MEKKVKKQIPVRILHLEDFPHDAELIREMLIDAGLEPVIDCVADGKEYVLLLRSGPYDIILADYKLPGFDGVTALKMANEICPHVPFICVSGTIGEEAAVELIQQGAVEYILKDRLNKLPSAIIRALDEARHKAALRQAEKNLRESEERFRIIASNTPDHILIQDLDLRYQFVVNPQLGLTEADMIGKTDRDFLRKEEAENLTAIKSKVLETGESFQVELPIKNSNGEVEYFDGSYLPKRDSAGKIDGLIGYFRNMTERKRAEKELLESEKKYRKLFTEMIDGFADHEIICDDEGNAVDYITLTVNNTYEALLKVICTDVVGKRASEILPQQEFKQWLEIFGPVALKGISTRYEMYSPQNKKHFEGIAYSPEKGKFAVTFSDITDRKKAENALHESEEQYRRLIEHLNELIIKMDSKKRLTFVSPNYCQTFGVNKDDIIGQSFFPLIHENDREIVTRSFERLNIPPYKTYHEERAKTVNGWRWFGWSLKAIVDEKNQILEILAVGRDITDRKQMENALKESESKHRLLFENAGVAIGYFTLDGKIISFNQKACQNLGAESTDIIGKTMIHLFGEEAGKVYLKRINLAAESAVPMIYEDFVSLPIGKKWLISTYVRIQDDNGMVVGVQVISDDITEIKNAEQKLKDKMTEMERFNKIMTGREMRMIELKQEVNALCDQLGIPKKYQTPEDN